MIQAIVRLRRLSERDVPRMSLNCSLSFLTQLTVYCIWESPEKKDRDSASVRKCTRKTEGAKLIVVSRFAISIKKDETINEILLPNLSAMTPVGISKKAKLR